MKRNANERPYITADGVPRGDWRRIIADNFKRAQECEHRKGEK